MGSRDLDTGQVEQLQQRLEDLEGVILTLHTEIMGLQTEITVLRTENKMMKTEISLLREENKQLKGTIQRLEGRLRQYEGPNAPSSQTPVYLKTNSAGGDGTNQAKSPKSLASDKKLPEGHHGKAKRGQKKGHKGATIVRPPDRIQHDRVDECGNCQVPLLEEDQINIFGYRKLEIQISSEIVEHQAYRVRCGNCAHVTQTGPEHKATIFGNSALTLLGTLWYDCRVPLNRLSLFLEAISGDRYSEAVIIKGLNVISQRLNVPAEQFKQEVFNSAYIGIDETGYPTAINGRGLNWIWVFTTEEAVFYEFAETRGMKELEAIWKPPPEEVIPVVDGWRAYSYFPVIGRCWAHMLRLAKELAKRCERGKEISEDLHGLFHSIKSFRELRGEQTNYSGEGIKKRALQKLDDMIEQCKSGRARIEAKEMCEVMSKFVVTLENAKLDLLTGLDHPKLWLTNNISERDLRKLVIHRKIRGYVASEQGKKTLTNFATVFETWRLQHKIPYQELREILNPAAC